uniref:Secreted protein n=2 Tax=Rhizophora mucronata TaxID=61149 RepID=A0A2P2KMW5_RHIMU
MPYSLSVLGSFILVASGNVPANLWSWWGAPPKLQVCFSFPSHCFLWSHEYSKGYIRMHYYIFQGKLSNTGMIPRSNDFIFSNIRHALLCLRRSVMSCISASFTFSCGSIISREP